MSALFQHIVFGGRGNIVRIVRDGKRVRIEVVGNIAERVVIDVEVDDADLSLKGLHRG